MSAGGSARKREREREDYLSWQGQPMYTFSGNFEMVSCASEQINYPNQWVLSAGLSAATFLTAVSLLWSQPRSTKATSKYPKLTAWMLPPGAVQIHPSHFCDNTYTYFIYNNYHRDK